MDFFILAMLLAIGLHALKSRDQRERIVLLARELGNYQIEKLMESLTDGYLRALGEARAERREQIWQLLGTTEAQLVQQFDRFATEFARLSEASTRVSKLPWALPFARRMFPRATFDVRKAFMIHARGMAAAVDNRAQRSARDQAFTLSAELLLMQHTCHWFCRSKNVASARIFLRHKTPYAQVLASVSGETRQAYLALAGA